MIFLPIVERELRVAARRSETHWMRCLLVAIVFGFWFLLMTLKQAAAPADLGHLLFVALAIASFGFCLLAGLIFTSDCLSAEKRMDTLGLLFLTDLKGYDVVSGKLAAHSLHAFYGLMGVLPLLGLPLFLGGVSVGEFARLVVVLMVSMFQSLAMALWVSAEKRDARQSLLASFVVIAALAGLMPMLWWIGLRSFSFMDCMLLLSPGYALSRSFDLFYQAPLGAREFWLSSAMVGLTGLVGLGLACLRMPRVWRNHDAPVVRAGQGTEIFLSRLTKSKSNRNNQKIIMEITPYGWVCFHDSGCRKWVRAIYLWVMPVWCLLLAISIMTPRSYATSSCFVICLISAYLLNQLFKIMVASEASRQVCEDYENGNLELVLTTSLTRETILDGVRRAMALQLNPLRNTLQIMNSALLGSALFFSERFGIQKSGLQVIICLIITGGWFMLYIDYWALSQAALAAAFRANTHHRAMLVALGKVMGPSWGMLLIMVLIMAGTGGGAPLAFALFIWLFFGIFIVVVQGQMDRGEILLWSRAVE